MQLIASPRSRFHRYRIKHFTPLFVSILLAVSFIVFAITNQYSASTPVSAGTAGQRTLRVLVIDLDPNLPSRGNQRTSAFLGQSADVDLSVSELVEDLEYGSNGKLDVSIVAREQLNEFTTFKSTITLKNGTTSHRLDEETWLEIMKDGWHASWSNPYFTQIPDFDFDYSYFVDRLNLVERRNNNEFDQVWLVNTGPTNNYESMMVGSAAYWINGPALIRPTTNFAIMNVSVARRDVNLECFGHAAENIMTKVFKGSRIAVAGSSGLTPFTGNISELNLWERFTSSELSFPSHASVGSVHFAPNSSRDLRNHLWLHKTQKTQNHSPRQG